MVLLGCFQWGDNTAIDRAHISFDGVTLDVSVNDPVGGNPVSFSSLTAMDVQFVNASAGMVVAAPNVVGNFDMDVDLSNYPWLQFDWDQDGDFNDVDDVDLPTTNIRFHTYRGHDKIIYWREVLQ